MQRYQKEIIRKHFERLVEDMEPNPVVRYLFEKGIISKEDMEAIRSKDTSNKQNEDLLLMLMRKGPDAFKRLIEALQKNKSPLADILLDGGNKSIKYDESLKLETYREIGSPVIDVSIKKMKTRFYNCTRTQIVLRIVKERLAEPTEG